MLPIILSKHFLFIAGMTLILIAYFFQPCKWMGIKGFLYNFLNTLGAGLLVYIAFQPLQLKFLTIAALWLLISIFRLFKSFK